MFDNLGNSHSSITKMLEGVSEVRDLINEHVTPELEKEMNHEQLEQLAEARKMTDPAMLKRKAYELMNSIKNK